MTLILRELQQSVMTDNEDDSGRRIILIILVVGIQKFASWKTTFDGRQPLIYYLKKNDNTEIILNRVFQPNMLTDQKHKLSISRPGGEFLDSDH